VGEEASSAGHGQEDGSCGSMPWPQSIQYEEIKTLEYTHPVLRPPICLPSFTQRVSNVGFPKGGSWKSPSMSEMRNTRNVLRYATHNKITT
jgi:hypothetical protein